MKSGVTLPLSAPQQVYQIVYEECDGFVECGASPQIIWEGCRRALLDAMQSGVGIPELAPLSGFRASTLD